MATDQFPQVYRYHSGKAGKHLLIFGNIHGNEPCGREALEDLNTKLARGEIVLTQGQLTLVPVCNPKAALQGTAWTEENLNRIFCLHNTPSTYEQTLANFLYPLVQEADVLLDLHSTTAPTSPFLFLDYETPDALAWAQSLGLGYALLSWPALHPEDGADSTTQDFAHGIGKVALTVECGQHAAPSAVETAKNICSETLQYFGLIPTLQREKTVLHRLRLTHMFLKKTDGHFSKNWQNFSSVSAGEEMIIYTNGEKILAPTDGYLIMPKEQAEIGEDWLYFAVAA